MSENWQAGDLALCINNGRADCRNGCQGISSDLVKGKVYLVDGVAIMADTLSISLVGVKLGSFGTYRIASRFIKVTPSAPDEFDRETIELMRGKPVEVA